MLSLSWNAFARYKNLERLFLSNCASLFLFTRAGDTRKSIQTTKTRPDNRTATTLPIPLPLQSSLAAMCKIEYQDIWCKITSCQNTVAAEQPIYTKCKKADQQYLVWGVCGKTDQWRKPAKRSRTIECPDCVARRKEQEERRLQALAREAAERSELENEGRAHWGNLGYVPILIGGLSRRTMRTIMAFRINTGTFL